MWREWDASKKKTKNKKTNSEGGVYGGMGCEQTKKTKKKKKPRFTTRRSLSPSFKVGIPERKHRIFKVPTISEWITDPLLEIFFLFLRERRCACVSVQTLEHSIFQKAGGKKRRRPGRRKKLSFFFFALFVRKVSHHLNAHIKSQAFQIFFLFLPTDSIFQ